MSRFPVLLCVILLPEATGINVTNSGNQEEIKAIKKDLTMLKNLVTSLNTSLISAQIDKDGKVKEMNASIQAQLLEMKSMNATIQAQHVEMTLMNSTIYAQQQKMNASSQDYQQELRILNATIHAQKHVERSMNITIETQQKEMTYLKSTVQDQQHKMKLMESALKSQRHIEISLNSTMQDQRHKIVIMESTIQSQRQIEESINSTIQDQQQKIALMKSAIQYQQQLEGSLNSAIKDQQQKMTLMESSIQSQRQIEESLNTIIQDQQHKMTTMESTLQILEQDNQTLRKGLNFLSKNSSAEMGHLKELEEKGNKKYEAFQLIIQDLVTNVNTLRNTSQQQIGSINDNLISLAKQIHYTSLSFLDAQKMLKDLENSSKETKVNVSSMFKKLESQGQEMQNLQSEKNGTYAFTVSTSFYLSYYNNKKIVYDKVITNKGGAYNSNTGIFTCPSPGTYVFTWSTMSRTDSETCIAYIYHNGNRLLMSQSGEQNGGYNEVASNTILLTLTVGDRVWIQTSTGTYCYRYPFTAFSGWKI